MVCGPDTQDIEVAHLVKRTGLQSQVWGGLGYLQVKTPEEIMG